MSGAFCSLQTECCRSNCCCKTTSSVTSIFVFVPALLWRKLQKARHLLHLGMPCIEMQVSVRLTKTGNDLLTAHGRKMVCHMPEMTKIYEARRIDLYPMLLTIEAQDHRTLQVHSYSSQGIQSKHTQRHGRAIETM